MMFRALSLALLIVMGTAVSAGTQSMFSNPSLYQDRRPSRANRVGDILTVMVMETTSASNRSNIETGKTNKIDFDSGKGTGPLRFIPGLGLVSDASTEFTGEGATSRQQQIQARVSVTVMGTKPNGDLIVEGSRTMEVNGEREVIYLSGSVNPLIIPANNTIESYLMADLQVSYKGRGVVSQGSRPGFLVRFFNWIL